jgi:hypothetical protein
MKRWIGAGLLAATLMVTGCASNGYGRNYRYDRDYRYRYYRDHDDRHRDYDRDRDHRDERDNWR